MEIFASARRHGVADEDIVHAMDHALVIADYEDDERCLYLGPNRTGNLLEVISVGTVDGVEIVIHAMPMRPMYLPLLEQFGEHS